MNTGYKVLIVLILILILKYYYKASYDVNKSFNIIQTPLSKMNYNLLYEKSPIIINELVYNPNELVEKMFKYLYTRKHVFNYCKIDKLYTNLAKYAIISCKTQDIIINLYHPFSKDRFMPVKLYKDQCMIVPSLWSYSSSECQDIYIIKLYDIPILIKNFFNKNVIS